MSEQQKTEDKFRKALEHFLNEWCADGATDTPDHILAQYMIDCLEAYSKAKKAVEKWQGGTEAALIPRQLNDPAKSLPFNDYGLTEAQFLLLRDIFEERQHPRPRRAVSGDYDVLLKYGLIKTTMLRSGRDPVYGYITTEAGNALMFK